MNESQRSNDARSPITYIAVLVVSVVGLSLSVYAIRNRSAGSSQTGAQLNENPVSKTSANDVRSGIEKISFVRGGWIYVKDIVGGTETRLIQGLSPQLSPTGETLVFISVKENQGIMDRIFPQAGQLRLMNLKTRQIHDFESLRDSRVGDPIWSNDGTKIAVTVDKGDSKTPSIAVLNSTGNLEKLISTVSSTVGMVSTLTHGSRVILRSCSIH